MNYNIVEKILKMNIVSVWILYEKFSVFFHKEFVLGLPNGMVSLTRLFVVCLTPSSRCFVQVFVFSWNTNAHVCLISFQDVFVFPNVCIYYGTPAQSSRFVQLCINVYICDQVHVLVINFHRCVDKCVCTTN